MAQHSNYSGNHSDSRPTLPPIRDLFRDEFSRLERDEKSQYSPSLPFSRLQVVDNADRSGSLENHKSSLRKGQPMYDRFDPRQYPESFAYSQQSIPSGMASSSYAAPDRIEYSISHSSLKSSDNYREPSYVSYPGSQEYAPYIHSSGMTSVAYPQASIRSYTKDHALIHQRSANVLTDVRTATSTWNTATALSSVYRTEDDERTPVARFVDSSPYGLVNIPHADVYQQEESMQGVGSKYDCSYCGKGFNRPSSLKIHLNSHTGEKPFVCPVESCGRSFSVLSNMRRHARVHTVPADQEPPSGELGASSSSAARVHMRRRSSTSSSNASTVSRRSRSISSNDEHTEWENHLILDKRLRRNIA